MALLANKFADNILISIYSSGVLFLWSLSLSLPLEEWRETEFHSHKSINHFNKKKGVNEEDFFLSGWCIKQTAWLRREVVTRMLGAFGTAVLVNIKQK